MIVTFAAAISLADAAAGPAWGTAGGAGAGT
jgi:hypothetical protein